MTRSPSRSALRQLLPALLAAVTALPLASCDGADPVALSFSDYLRHQGGNVTTGPISVTAGLDTGVWTYGWRLHDGEPPSAELVQNIGHIRLFAAEPGARQLLLRGSMDRPEAAGSYRLLINGRALGRVAFDGEWRQQRVELPRESLRVGPNLLALRCLECPAGRRHQGPKLRLAQLRLRPAPSRPGTIRKTETDPEGTRFLMPSTAYLDVVAQLPTAAVFRGEVTVAAAASEPVDVALRVLGPGGERQAGEWRLGGGETRVLRADLSPWAGQLVRLRLAATANDSAELDWRRAVVTGSGGAPNPERPLAEPEAPPRSRRLGRPEIVLVLLDAARADAFAPFGGLYPTPALDSLAADGTSFLEAWAPASWTGPSVSALLTGFYPDSVHSELWGATLPSQVQTLAELLTAAGYRTVLWHQHPFYRGRKDLQRGFSEVYWARTNVVDPVPPPDLLSSGDRPTFTFVHLLPPHAPYEPPAPFRGAYSSWYTGGLEVTAETLNQFHGQRDPRELSADDRRYVRDRYLENAAYADSLVGRIRDLVITTGRYDDTLFLVLSDHGESFLEHGRFLHTQQLYGESIRVPLVVKWPAATSPRRAVVDEPVSLIDLLPTLVDGLGLETDHPFQGRSLLPVALDGRRRGGMIYAVTRGATDAWRPPATRVALRYGPLKAIYAPLEDRLELYDVTNDPAEIDDLSAARPLSGLLMRQAVLEQMELNGGLFATEAAAGAPLDPAVEDGLRALGYLGEQ
jgi:arylsulfatase A-like enzyme